MRESTEDNSGHEKERLHDPKQVNAAAGTVVLEPHRGLRLLRYWIHVAALGVTAVLSGMSLANLYYTDANDPNIVAKLGAFQFIAKMHEILLGASISMIILDRIRTGLLSLEGVPLGRLLSSEQLTSIDYLISSQFWMPFRGKHSLSIRTLPMSFLLLIAVPFAFVSGPLSAILVVPRPGWSLAKPAALLPLFTNVTAAQLWPENVDASFLQQACFSDGLGETTSGCPAAAAKVIAVQLSVDYGNVPLCSTKASTLVCNASIDTPTTESIARPMTIQMSQEGASTIVSTLDARISRDLGNYLYSWIGTPLDLPGSEPIDTHREQLIEISLLGGAQMYKPVVASTCRDLTTTEIADLMVPVNGKLSSLLDWTHPALYWTEPEVGTSTNPQAIFTWPRNYTDGSWFDQPEACSDDASCHAAISCTIDPRWAPVKLWYDTQTPRQLYQDNPTPADYNVSGSLRDSTRPIHIGRQWLRNFDRGYTGGYGGLSPMTFRIITFLEGWKSSPQPLSSTSNTSPDQSFRPATYPQALSVILSTTIGEALAEIQEVWTFGRPFSPFRGRVRVQGPCGTVGIDGTNYDSDIAVLGKEICSKSAVYWATAKDLGNLDTRWTMYKFSVRHYGYGWFMNSVTIDIALAVLLLHALLTVLYMCTLPFKKTISTCWDSVAELFILALDSLPADRLAGNGTSVHDSKIWRERVTVREISGKAQLSLVVGDPARYGGAIGKLPELGKKYD